MFRLLARLERRSEFRDEPLRGPPGAVGPGVGGAHRQARAGAAGTTESQVSRASRASERWDGGGLVMERGQAERQIQVHKYAQVWINIDEGGSWTNRRKRSRWVRQSFRL